MRRDGRSPVDFRDEVVLPALFERLDQVFPEFEFRRTSASWWTARKNPPGYSYGAEEGKLTASRFGFGSFKASRPFVPWTAYVNGGETPTGRDFVDAVRKLAEAAGVDASVLDRELTPGELRRRDELDRRQALLETFFSQSQAALCGEAGLEAVAYLVDRGFPEDVDELVSLPFGYYSTTEAVAAQLESAGFTKDEVQASGLLRDGRWEGRLVIAWRDRWSRPGTFAARDLSGTAGAGSKYLYLTREHGWARSKADLVAFGLDVALRSAEGRRDLVLVEGLLDCLQLQSRGFDNVAALGGLTPSPETFDGLARLGVRRVTLALDFDPKDNPREPTVAAVKNALRAEEPPVVYAVDPVKLWEAAGRLERDGRPVKVDPDSLVLERGRDGFEEVLRTAETGGVFLGLDAVGDVKPTSPEKDRRDAVDRFLDFDARLRGPGVELDREDLLQLVAERTGYTFDALESVAEDHRRRRDRDETEKRLQRLLRESADKLTGDDRDDVFGVAADLSVELAGLVSRSEDPPPAFSVDRLHRQVSEAPAGKPSGWDALDRLDVRFQPQELALVAGRTSHAKTTVLVNLFANWLDAGERDGSDELLVFYSAEEPENRIFCRLVGLLSAWENERDGWSANDVRDYLREEDRYFPALGAYNNAWERLRSWEARLQIVNRPGWTIDRLVAHARDLAARQPVGAVFVDYLQRIPPPADIGKGRRRDEEVSAVARLCKSLAVDLSVPVVAGAQINRSAVTDAARVPTGLPYDDPKVQKAIRSRRPELHHLREGGSEQEADLVLGLLNYWADYSESEDGDERPAAVTIPKVTRLEIGSLKNRFGEVGKWAGLALCGRLGLVRDPERGEVG